MAENGVIGNGNALPWDIPEDMAHFKRVTMGKPVIMGRKTFESIGRPLPGRRNIVMTRGGSIDGCFVAGNMEEALTLAEGADEVMVIGGASIYEQFMPLTRRIYLTEIDRDFKGDAFFPELDYNEWEEVSRVKGKDGFPFKYSFVIFEKNKSKKER